MSDPLIEWPIGVLSKASFIELVKARGSEGFRELPWRYIDDPYAVLVSEVMLQQTQVKRVLGYWSRFMGMFPTIDALASADTAVVLEHWQGLGYNRRALALKRAAEISSRDYSGTLPSTIEELQSLPGIGPATAAGVMAFAYNRPAVYLETNVRTVFIHHVFPDDESVSDKVLRPLIADTCPYEDPRTWYYRLLDYGAMLKREVSNPSRRSAHYARQSAFTGSRRQKRAEIVRLVLAAGSISLSELHSCLNQTELKSGRGEVSRDDFDSIVTDLASEGFFHVEGGCVVG